MARTPNKELKAVNNYDFYPQHYLTGALADDAKAKGFDGKGLQKERAGLEKALQALAEESLARSEAIEARRTLATSIFKLLGYYERDGEPNALVGLRHKAQMYGLKVEKKFALRAEGELWIVIDGMEAVSASPEGSDSDDGEEVADAESLRKGEVEHFYQRPVVLDCKGQAKNLSWKDVVTSLFDSDELSCEWLVINQGDRLILVERGRWQETHAYLEVMLPELFAINDPIEYQIVEALFSPRSFPIDSAEFFHETLEQNAHKKAAEVTKALRDTVRESIEIIANEILAHHRRAPLKALKGMNLAAREGSDQAAQVIFDQSLRYIYRILFMLFAESQEQRLGSLPVSSRPYQLGYAMERLRELEGIPLMEKDRNFIQQTLAHTTRIYFAGYNKDAVHATADDGEVYQKTDALGFSFPELGTDLFDYAKTPIFQEAILSDGEMQKVIRRLSLARVGSGKSARTQRVHYAGLGLNQLGAVYEGLLSLKPEILQQDVILLTKEKKDAAHRYVPAKDKAKFDKKMFAEDEDGLMTRRSGEFLLTPVGLERKFSASFYTPEVLTRFLAKEAVDTLLEKDASLERLENLKICEPAMGSGAFLNAVVDEIAPRMAREYRKIDQKAYDTWVATCEKKGLDPKKENGPLVQDIGHYLSKAKYHLMQRCVFGVDLNPTAVELAKVSLWLNCLHDDGNLPFLDFKLKHGNSLVGGWVTRHHYEGTEWPHFLVPNPKAISPHLDGLVLGIKSRPFIEDEAVREKMKSLQKDWAECVKKESVRKRLDKLAQKVKSLYKTHLEYQSEYRQAMLEAESSAEKVMIYERFMKENSAYNQLRSMMDYWCSLWFWPHSKIKSLPSSEDFLTGLEWMAETALTYGGPERVEQIKDSGLKELMVARDVAVETKFFHWDLEYADVFAEGGFDLVLGNPPWAPVRWEEADFFEAASPGIHEKKGDSKARSEAYSKVLSATEHLVEQYHDAACKVDGLSIFLRQSGTYSFRDSSQTNTYRYFYQRFYMLTRLQGVHAMIAQDGILTDDGCTEIRPTFYRELERFFRYKNDKSLFEDIASRLDFSVWVSRKGKDKVQFESVQNLFACETVEACRKESENAPYRGLKTIEGGWETNGHPKRIISIDKNVLKSFACFEGDSLKDETLINLPIIHGVIELEVLKRLAEHRCKMNIREMYFSPCFHEAQSPKKGYISRNPGRSKSLDRACLTGPNVFVGHPARKIPNPGCQNHADFSEVDLNTVPDDFFPDTVYQTTEKGLKSPEYNSQTPWGTTHSAEPRIIARQMVNTTGVRTLSSALIPPGPSHVHSMSSLSFKDRGELVYTSGLFHSLIYDFLMRSISGGTIGQGIFQMAPTLTPEQIMNPLVPALKARALRLSCISKHYQDLWKEAFDTDFGGFEIDSSYAPQLSYQKLSSKWTRHSCIRDNQQREQALCEIDAIVAILFGFDKETLLNLYRSQFGVLQKNLQDLPDQTVDPEKYHFPRYQQMSAAYDQCVAFLKSKKKWPPKAA